MKFKARTKDCRLMIRAKTSFGEEIDEKALDAFARLGLRGFLKPKQAKKHVVAYSGPVGVSLYERLKKPIARHEFLFIMEQMVVTVQKMQNNSLNANNLILDLQNVYINDTTKEIQFLYIPLKKESRNEGVVAFIEAIVYSAVPASERDADCIQNFTYFLKAQTGFDPETVEGFIAKEDRSVVNTIKRQNARQSGFMTSKQKHYLEHYGAERADSDDPTGLLKENDDEATGKLDEEDEATGKLDEEDETGWLMDGDDEGTALLKENSSVHYPTLFRVLTEETICINKPVFRLGKERSYVDYFVTNNNAISRSHADLITRGNKYFIMDLNSKNHTYINGQMLPVQCEIEIRDGDMLRLGNEEFIFRI